MIRIEPRNGSAWKNHGTLAAGHALLDFPLAPAAFMAVFALMPILAATAQEPKPAIEISLITILPGEPVYSSFGHTAIRIVDRTSGSDLFYTYGQSARPFDLLFLADLLRGRMEFMVDSFDTRDAVRFYSKTENRTIIEQALRIDQGHAARLKARLERDALPENRNYRYRFFEDNCATRVWLLLEDVAADLDPRGMPSTRKTFRESIDEVLAEKSWLRFGLAFLVGPFADRPREVEKAVFLPREIMDQAKEITVKGPSGRENLLGQQRVIYLEKDEPPSFGFPVPSHALAVLFLLSVFMTLRVPKESLASFIFDTLLFGGMAILGLVPGFLWLSSGYGEAAMNANLLWANPLPLAALVWKRVRPRHKAANVLFIAEAASAVAVAFSGGFGFQSISPELRLACALVAFRCVSQLGLSGRLKKVRDEGRGIGKA